MVDTILSAWLTRPGTPRVLHRQRRGYKARLRELDDRFRSELSQCGKQIFLHGGHFAFGYLANRYRLRYESAYAVSANAEPSPAKIAQLIRQIKKNGLHNIYTEELVEPRIADTISRETGATVLKLHGAHNISKEDLAAGVTFLSLMEQNLKNLRSDCNADRHHYHRRTLLSYQGSECCRHNLHDQSGDYLGVVGPNGSGKST
jgi:zinc transport system substrate-binding protein